MASHGRRGLDGLLWNETVKGAHSQQDTRIWSALRYPRSRSNIESTVSMSMEGIGERKKR